MGAMTLAKEELTGPVYGDKKRSPYTPAVEGFHSDQTPYDVNGQAFKVLGLDHLEVVDDGVVVGRALHATAGQRIEIGRKGRTAVLESKLPSGLQSQKEYRHPRPHQCLLGIIPLTLTTRVGELPQKTRQTRQKMPEGLDQDRD